MRFDLGKIIVERQSFINPFTHSHSLDVGCLFVWPKSQGYDFYFQFALAMFLFSSIVPVTKAAFSFLQPRKAR